MPEQIIAKARSYIGRFTDGADVPAMAREIGERWPEMAAYCRQAGEDTPWCGIFVAYVLTQCGIRPPYTPNSSDYDDFMWADAPIEGRWGVQVSRDQAQPGDIVVLRVPHHITILDRDAGDGQTFYGTGGNQSNGVTTARFYWRNIRGIVRPVGADAPVIVVKPVPKPPGHYEMCIGYVLESEGGNDDDPRDPGGRTSRGILQREWDVWKLTHAGLPSDVWSAPQKEVLAIYRAKYWNAQQCDNLPMGVDYCVFDYGVNSGIRRSAMVLQRFVGAVVDGEIGPETLSKTLAADPVELIRQISDERLTFLRGLSIWSVYGVGWTRRVNAVRTRSLEMANETVIA